MQCARFDPSNVEDLLKSRKEVEAIGPHNIEILEQVFNCAQCGKIVSSWDNSICTAEALKRLSRKIT